MISLLTHISESSSWYLRPIHGRRWFGRPIYWSFDPVACLKISNCISIRGLCCSFQWNFLHHAWSIRPYCCWFHDVWCHQVVRDSRSNPVRINRQSRLRVTILVSCFGSKMDRRFYGTSQYLRKSILRHHINYF